MSLIGVRFKKHPLYLDYIQVQERLKKYQFVCWLAGGAVRDLFLGRDCEDFDLVTDANTENLKLIFPEALLVGEKFGVLKIILKQGGFFDLTTFRQESDYKDGRRPTSVSASTPQKDAFRRDFTINALFWDDENQQLIDFVTGVSDLGLKKIVAVGDPKTRFLEDHLRILRLIRFAAELQFEIDEPTLQAALSLVTYIHKVSGERIWSELKKIKSPRSWNFALKTNLFQKILIEIFGVSFEKDFSLTESRRDQDREAHLYYVLSKLALDSARNPVEFKNALVKKLHVSKEEQSRLDFFINAQSKYQTYTAEKMSLELEKKPGLQDVLQYLVHQNTFSQEKLKKAQDLLNLYPQTLITGEDLKDLIEVRSISVALNEVRLRQLEGVVQDKEQALNYIKNNFTIST